MLVQAWGKQGDEVLVVDLFDTVEKLMEVQYCG